MSCEQADNHHIKLSRTERYLAESYKSSQVSRIIHCGYMRRAFLRVARRRPSEEVFPHFPPDLATRFTKDIRHHIRKYGSTKHAYNVLARRESLKIRIATSVS